MYWEAVIYQHRTGAGYGSSQQTGGGVQRVCGSADTSVMSQRRGIFPDAAGEPEQSGDGAEISRDSSDLRHGGRNTRETFAR